MKIKIRTKDFRFSMPVPAAMIGTVVRWLPESVFEQMRADTPEPYRELLTKEVIGRLFGECVDVIKENKGLEAVHVEARDGSFVSIRF